MSKEKGLEGVFDGRHVDREIIVLCVRLYFRYKRSLRDLVEMIPQGDFLRGVDEGFVDGHRLGRAIDFSK
jgi:hypothetical protein